MPNLACTVSMLFPDMSPSIASQLCLPSTILRQLGKAAIDALANALGTCSTTWPALSCSAAFHGVDMHGRGADGWRNSMWMASALIWHLRFAEIPRATPLQLLPSYMIWRRTLCSARCTCSACPPAFHCLGQPPIIMALQMLTA